MKVCVTATEKSLDAAIDPRFGRCACFLIVDTDSLEVETLENPNVALGGGAGIQSAQMVAGAGVEAVLTGNCGPNAYSALAAANIKLIVGCSGSVRDAVEAYKAGKLNAADQPNVGSKFGMGGGRGMGGGGGMGQGGGMGRGRS